MGKSRWQRKKRVGKAVEARDDPTPQTIAKLVKPCWENWSGELQRSVVDIDLAARLIAGRSVAQALDLAHVSKAAAADWSDAQIACVRRYLQWSVAMKRVGWPLQPVLGAIVHGEPVSDVAQLWRAVALHATGRILAASRHPFHNNHYRMLRRTNPAAS